MRRKRRSFFRVNWQRLLLFEFSVIVAGLVAFDLDLPAVVPFVIAGVVAFVFIVASLPRRKKRRHLGVKP